MVNEAEQTMDSDRYKRATPLNVEKMNLLPNDPNASKILNCGG